MMVEFIYLCFIIVTEEDKHKVGRLLSRVLGKT